MSGNGAPIFTIYKAHIHILILIPTILILIPLLHLIYQIYLPERYKHKILDVIESVNELSKIPNSAIAAIGRNTTDLSHNLQPPPPQPPPDSDSPITNKQTTLTVTMTEPVTIRDRAKSVESVRSQSIEHTMHDIDYDNHNNNPNIETREIEKSRSRTTSKANNKSENKSKSNSSTNKELHIPWQAKTTLTIYMICSFLYLYTTLSQTLFFFIPIPSSFTAHVYCVLWQDTHLISYTIGRICLYIFFILRTYDTFRDTTYAYGKCLIYALITFAFCICFIVTIPWVYSLSFQSDFKYKMIDKLNGQYCYNTKAEERPFWITSMLGVAFLGELFLAFSSCYLLIHKLFLMLNKMGEVQDVHSNSLVLLVCRLVVLLLVAVGSSYFCFLNVILFGFDYVTIGYSFDTAINLYCLWLTFSFSEHYFVRYFCGMKCVYCCFPIIKTLAVTCDSKQHSNQCFNCCCYCCRYCCISRKRSEQKSIYQKAKKDIELIISSEK